MTRAAEPIRPSFRPAPSPPAIPPLRNGDNLNRAEFIRRYDAMPADVKAELIEGIVYMPPPVNQGFHSGPHFDLVALLASTSLPPLVSSVGTTGRCSSTWTTCPSRTCS